MVNEHDLKPLKGIITKTIIETNAQELQKKTEEGKTGKCHQKPALITTPI